MEGRTGRRVLGLRAWVARWRWGLREFLGFGAFFRVVLRLVLAVC